MIGKGATTEVAAGSGRQTPTSSRPMVTLSLSRGRELRWDRRSAITCLGLGVAIMIAGAAALCVGDGWSNPSEVIDGLLGRGPLADRVLPWRLPRVAAGMLFGVALGLAGAVFQNLTRNPLGAPDVIGLDQGAYTGVLLVLTIGGGAGFSAAADTGGGLALGLGAAAFMGGLAAAVLVGVLAAGSGYSGMQLVVIGIAVNAVLTAINSWLILRADIDVAMAAASWSAGSLNGIDWSELVLPTMAVSLLVACLALLSRPLQQFAVLGDDLAVTSGIRLSRTRLGLVVSGVGLTAVVAAVVGPIVFVALMAPQIGRRLAGAVGIPLLPAAMTGATLLVAADLIAQIVIAPVQLPVGVVTGALGGVYLLWLLFKEAR